MRTVKRRSSIWSYIGPYFLGVAIVLVIAAGVRLFLGRADTSSQPEVPGDVFLCRGCGKAYVNQCPYVSPWAGYPTEPSIPKITDIKETSRNGSISRATPVSMFQRVTGNLSSRDDKDFYSFTVDTPGDVTFLFSHDGSRGGYIYLWAGTIYGTDRKTKLKALSIPSEDGKETDFGVSDLEPGTYYLEISAVSGGNPLLNGYSDTHYHITFLPKCAEHTSVTQVIMETPTCSQAGQLMTQCNTCPVVVSTEVLEPLEHIWSTWKTVEKISLRSPLGKCSRVCALCGEEETGALLFHLLDRAPKTDPEAVRVTVSPPSSSCAADGFLETVCSVCGNVEAENAQALGHTYGEWEITRAATCSAEGQRSRACADCGYVEVESLPQTPYTYGKSVRVSGSIWDAPIVSRKSCTECGYIKLVESGWSRWVLPALVIAGAAAAVLSLFLARRMIRKQRSRNTKKQLEKAFLCPYCFESSQISQIQFRCTNQLCEDLYDPEMTRYEHGVDDPLKGKRGKPTFGRKQVPIQWDARGIPHSAQCPKCGRTTYKVICPKCHNPLPASTLTGDNMIISVVGSRDTGKTHFITVIVNELIERIAPAFGGSFEGFDDTMDRYTRIYKNQLYVHLQRFKKTDRFLENMDGAYRPLIYSLKLRVKGPLGEKIRLYTLVFFDSAGEDLESEESMRTVNQYICKSTGIIFLLDPLKIPAVKAQLDQSAVSRASSASWYQPDDILVRVSNLIRREQGLRDCDKIKVPVAVVFSKLDVIEPIIPQGCTILEPSAHCRQGVFNLSDCHNVNTEVQGLLRTWEAGSFLSQLSLNYQNYACFAVSSLGMHNSPDSNGIISRPHPHRIEDPLLWLLMKQKVIKGKQ